MMHSNHPKPGHPRLRGLLLALALLLAPLLRLALLLDRQVHQKRKLLA